MTSDNRAVATQLAGMIGDYQDAAGTGRKTQVNRIITFLLPHFRNWSSTFCRLNGDTYGSHRDDVISVVAERVLTVLEEVLDGKHEKVANWYSYLNGIGRYAALAYFNSPEVTAASGMVALQRKQRHIARVREGLRTKLGREPQPAEIVEEANAQMLARRSNPQKQGALVTLDDIDVPLSAADIADHDREVNHDDDAVLSPIEGRQLVELIIDVCFQHSKQLGETAELWVGDAYSEPPYLGTANDIARTFHIGQSKAAALLDEAREIAQDACLDRFGISFPAA